MHNTKLKTTKAPKLSVMVPTGADMVSTQMTMFNIPSVNPAANVARVFPDLASGNLLLVGQYCDQGCSAHFHPTNMSIKNATGDTILKGVRDTSTRL